MGDASLFDDLILDMLSPPDSSRQRNRKRKLAAAKVLRGMKAAAGNGKRGRSFTVCICGKFSRKDRGGDLVVESTAAGKTNLGNAQFCASAWTCADCAQHIGITRGTYVEKAITALENKGYRVVMTTMTVPHQLGETCDAVFDRLKAAHAELDSDGSYRAKVVKWGYIGRIRVIEITHGASGWHVHSHELMVFKGAGRKITKEEAEQWAADMQKGVFKIWNRIIKHVTGGQRASEEHGFKVDAVWSNNPYIAKTPEAAVAAEKVEAAKGKPEWGVQAELTKAHVKKADKGGRTPWDILDGCYAGNEADVALFVEYAQAVWNRTQFQTSRPLKELLASLDVSIGTDDQIVLDDPDFVFADELKPDGDQSNIVIERVLIDRESQGAAHVCKPLWLEQVRHDVELHRVLTLVEAMQAQGFRLELVSAGHFVTTKTNIDAAQGKDYDRNEAIIDAHYEPSIYRAVFGPPEPE